ncbi:MAG: hypothetical protein PHO67_07010 [Candidatus Omnitrophica bacterium]|nr:hypothetical protein [Candidatus Omnitrophota bacterium]
MKYLIPVVLIFIIFGCSSREYDPEYLKRAEKLPEYGVVYVGMPKEDLAKAGYTEYLQMGYHKEGTDEWITFSNWTSKERGDTITFYMKDGRVKGWKENSRRSSR